MTGEERQSQPGRRVYLRSPSISDRDEMIALAAASRSLHHPWVFPPTDRERYQAYLGRLSPDTHWGFLICLRGSDRVAGLVNVSEVVRGSFGSAYLGYWIGAPYAGRGLMREGLAQVVDLAFHRRGLHRLEANIQPENHRSMALVRRLGFVREGFSRRYLRIAGVWRDHERWALLADEWPSPIP